MAHKILEEAQEMNDLLIKKWRRDLHQILRRIWSFQRRWNISVNVWMR